MHDLATLKYLNLRAGGAVCIVFLTAVFTRTGVQAGYPGGVPGFCARHPQARADRDLLTLASMSGGELGEILDAIEAEGLDLSACCAVADEFAGPLQACAGIEFFSTWHGHFAPGWMACLGKAPGQA